MKFCSELGIFPDRGPVYVWQKKCFRYLILWRSLSTPCEKKYTKGSNSVTSQANFLCKHVNFCPRRLRWRCHDNRWWVRWRGKFKWCFLFFKYGRSKGTGGFVFCFRFSRPIVKITNSLLVLTPIFSCYLSFYVLSHYNNLYGRLFYSWNTMLIKSSKSRD